MDSGGSSGVVIMATMRSPVVNDVTLGYSRRCVTFGAQLCSGFWSDFGARKVPSEHAAPFPTGDLGEVPCLEFPARCYMGVGRAWGAGEPRAG